MSTKLVRTVRKRRRETSPGISDTPIKGVVIGVLAGLNPAGAPLVDFAANNHGLLVALTTVGLSEEDVGCQVVLQFESADPRRPVILGVIQRPKQGRAAETKPIAARVDGNCLTITAAEEIVLQCGKASITLTRDGKVAIRGTYLLSRSSGVNRIQGGSIQLN